MQSLIYPTPLALMNACIVAPPRPYFTNWAIISLCEAWPRSCQTCFLFPLKKVLFDAYSKAQFSRYVFPSNIVHVIHWL